MSASPPVVVQAALTTAYRLADTAPFGDAAEVLSTMLLILPSVHGIPTTFVCEGKGPSLLPITLVSFASEDIHE